MPTTRAKRAIKNVGNHRSDKAALIAADYSPSYAASGHIKKTKGFRELMEKALPTGMLLKKHRELIAKEELLIVSDGNKDGAHVEKTGQPHSDALRALDMAYKLRGEYPKEAVNPNGGTVILINVSSAGAEKYGIKQKTVIVQKPE